MKRTRLLRRVARGVSHICFYTFWLFWLDAFSRKTYASEKREIRYAAAYFVHAINISRKDAIEERELKYFCAFITREIVKAIVDM